ncbi:hypothetical protein ZEAMMB73_Zm00001d018759 [Zea mays]|uniref:DUF4220 domain-containing protein n=1 Tax=Zea mays TaxID=4577 RepID=A0A1D6HRY9_MAIZE|nr:hypothetical protein ZEAMMB73_Zm00001d018759 [Zea mays]
MDPPGSNPDGVVNMTRAMQALSPLLKHPRATIVKVEGLVLAAAGLLLLQLFLGFYRRRWRSSVLSTVLRASSKLMEALIIYTLGAMQSSPIKNSSYPVWAAFLVMASAGTTAVQDYDFCGSFYNKYMEGGVDMIKYFFYWIMFGLLLDPNTYTFKTTLDLQRHLKNSRASSNCVMALFYFALFTKLCESIGLAAVGYKMQKSNLFFRPNPRKIRFGIQAVETEEYDPQSMKGNGYAVCYRPFGGGGLVTIDQVWYCLDGRSSACLKDLCLSYALFRQLIARRFFGLVVQRPKTIPEIKDHDFVFKKLLPSEEHFKRAFRIIEAELGFCYDYFFTKYYYTFAATNQLPVPFLQSLALAKITLILTVGVFAVRNSLVLETPNPIIQVRISRADYIITLLLLVIALTVELVHAAFYLASDWAQVSLATMYVKRYWYEISPSIFATVIAFLRRVTFSGQLMRNRMKQHSLMRNGIKQQDPVEVSDAVKRAVARSLISTYGGNDPTKDDDAVETSQWQDQMPFHTYSCELKGLSQLEVMLIWHIATEHCDISSGPAPTNRTTRDDDRGVAVHLSRYCAYLIGSVPELLPYHEADIAELALKVVGEPTEQEDDARNIFHKGIELGKQLERMADGDRWKALQDFWAKTTIHAAKSHYTTKQHMQHLESGGEFLTHIWALLAHAGILYLNPVNNEDQEDQANLGSGPSAAA